MKGPEISTLEHATLQEVTEAFNAAFIDYKIPLQMTETAMAAKIRMEGIQLRYSAGAYIDEKLVAFILNGADTLGGEKRIYNAGTGTLPSYRGRGISHALYRFLIPILRKEGYDRHQLEVFTDNERARKVYTDTGFQPKRLLQCFRGSVPLHVQPTGVTEAPLLPALFSSFHDVAPSWQNDFPSLLRHPEAHQVIGIQKEHEWVAYAVFAPATGRVRQFAVKREWRGQGLGRQLFAGMAARSGAPELVVTNLEMNETLEAFFKRLKFTHFLELQEMTLDTREHT